MILLDINIFISKTVILKLYNWAIENFKQYNRKEYCINLEILKFYFSTIKLNILIFSKKILQEV